jgi:hypothetical protein
LTNASYGYEKICNLSIVEKREEFLLYIQIVTRKKTTGKKLFQGRKACRIDTFLPNALSAEANVTISSIKIHTDNLNASEKKALSRTNPRLQYLGRERAFF